MLVLVHFLSTDYRFNDSCNYNAAAAMKKYSNF